MYLTFTINKKNKLEQLDLFQSILNDTNINIDALQNKSLPYIEYCTVKTNKIASTTFNNHQIKLLKTFLQNFAFMAKPFLEEGVDKHYSSFKIPKHNGKFREIDAPDAELKNLLAHAKNVLQNNILVHPHNAAFAYVPGRCSKHALEKHQYNQSRWYLHLDLKDFFSNCTEDFIHQQLQQVFPFSEMYLNEKTKQQMQILVSAALYKGRLPQGTPLSPFLTNIIMIPIDNAIYNFCKQWNKQHFVYTRYADDIDISSKYEFDYKELLRELNSILARQSPLQINHEKVHYGSNAGRNWHLGLMLNQQNQITVGYKKKRLIKQKLMNFCTNKQNWELDDIQTFLGELAYFKSIEPEYHDHLIKQYSNKYNQQSDIIEELRNLLNTNRALHA